MSYRALVVGLGQMGMGYDIDADPDVRVSTLARAFSTHPEFDLVGGVDPDNARRELFLTRYGLPAFSDVDVAIKEVRPEIVAIAVPTHMHHEVFFKLLRQGGVKAILCEKPLSYDLAEASEMVSAAASAGVALFTNYMRRCDSAVVEVRRRLASGEISGPIKGVCWYSKGLFNNGSHFLNLFQYWLGEVRDFEVVDPGRSWGDYDVEPDLKVEFESGAIYFHAARAECFSCLSVELISANGRLRYESGAMSWQSAAPSASYPGYIVLSPDVELIKSDAPRLQWAVVNQIARHLAGEKTSICTGSQGLSTMQVLSRIRQEL